MCVGGGGGGSVGRQVLSPESLLASPAGPIFKVVGQYHLYWLSMMSPCQQPCQPGDVLGD